MLMNSLDRECIGGKRKGYSNTGASYLMTENEFKKCKKYLHLADNDNFNPRDRFAKIHSGFH